MPAPNSIDELIDLARKSGVVDVQRLAGHVQKLREANELPVEPAKLAASLVQGGILTNFQSEQLVQGKWRRFTIGKYKVLERLGSGGMGSVFLCEHKFMRRRVAVKVLPSAKAADPSSLERFYREARAVAAVDHPNIVHAYDIDQDETLHFLVMEYVDGPSLQEIVRRGGPLSVERACHYISQAAEGLEHANRAGLVHRDIKPGNILVDSAGIVKVLDMGLARFFNDEEDMLTRKYDENVLGTADYLAPEQADDSHTVDIRADIYSLGGTFYFLLTGKTPFGEGTVAQKLMWHRTRQPKPISTYRDDIPDELQAVLNQMMAKEPEQRYQMPAEIADALSAWVQGPPIPPQEKEMPQLSPAASASASDSGSAVRKNQLANGGSSSRSNQRQSAGMEISPTVKFSGDMAEQIKRMTLAARRSLVDAESGNDASLGKDAAKLGISDTFNPMAVEDTPPQLPALKRTQPTRTLRERFKLDKAPRWAIISGAALAAGALFLLVWLSISQLFGSQRQHTVGKAGQFQSVKAALQAARPGDHIVLLDKEHREILAWDARELSDIVIRGADGVEVWWSPPADAGPEDVLLHLHNAKGFRMEGLSFSGEGLSRTLLRLSGQSPGLRVSNARFEGFTKSAIIISNCAGTQAQPVLIQTVSTSTGGREADCAILFDAQDVLPTNNEYITIKNARLNGAFSNEQVLFKKERSGTIIIN